MTKETFREQLPLYVIGALDGEELREFERYVDDHREQCEVEIVEFQEVANKLALAAPPATPSPKVFDRVLAAIEGPTLRQVREQPEQGKFNPSTLLFRWIPWGVTAVLCVLLMVLVNELKTAQSLVKELESKGNSDQSKLVELTQRLEQQADQFQKQTKELAGLSEQQRAQIETLQAANKQLASEKIQLIRATEDLRHQVDSQNVKFASLEQKVSEQEAFLELMKDPAISVANLADPKGGKSSAKVYWHSVTKKGMVVVSNLQAVPKGKGTSLELWTFCGDKPPAATRLFWTDETGHGAYPIRIPGNLACVDKFAVTVESTNDELFSAPKGSVVLVGP